MKQFYVEQTCQKCNGSGSISHTCTTCNGKGHSREFKTFNVTIPAGTTNGTKLRMRGLGEPGSNGEVGDLLLEIKVNPDSIFSRNGNNLESRAKIPLTKALLGGTVDIQTIYGDTVKLEIKPGTQNNEKGIIKGKGAANDRKVLGDHVVFFDIEIPKNLSEEQKELIKKFDDLSSTSEKKWFKF
jgi:molecular chaperone DnaJ